MSGIKNDFSPGLMPAKDLKERARGISSHQAQDMFSCWQRTLISDYEMPLEHMLQLTRLYLAELELLDEHGACGITVDDIGAFLKSPDPDPMPNVTYGALVHDGFLAAEEGDIEVLVTQLLLRAALGRHPTMSNIYLAYRDCLSGLDNSNDYTHEMELRDYQQCLRDNCITISHFSTAGILPACMMQEERYHVREALPSWPGQSMISSTPRVDSLMLARLERDCSGVHLVPGKFAGTGFGDQYGWYRGRWFVQLPSVTDFVENSIHHHYAICPENAKNNVLRIMCEIAFGFCN